MQGQIIVKPKGSKIPPASTVNRAARADANKRAAPLLKAFHKASAGRFDIIKAAKAAGLDIPPEPTLSKIKSAAAITLGYRESSIPFSYLGADQKPIGISMDLCAAIVERIKSELKLASLTVSYTPVNSSNRIPLIQNGTVDIECGGTANNLTRQKQVGFSVTTFVSQPRWLVKTTSGVANVPALKGKTVDQALAIKNTDIVAELSLPPVKIHCSVLAEDAIKAAIADYKKKQDESKGVSTAQQPAQPIA